MTEMDSKKHIRPHPDYENYKATWVQLYNTLNYGSSLSNRLLNLSHSLAENTLVNKTHLRSIIEVGAGPGVHLEFVRHSFDEYFVTDLRRDMIRKAKRKYASKREKRIFYIQENAAHLSFKNDRFDRLIAIHVLEHLQEPHEVLAEWARVVSSRGIITIVIPCDPGLLWRIGRHFGPRRNAFKFGLEYDYWMAREHINSAYNIINLIRYYFDRVQETWFPTRLPSVDLNLFFIAHIEV